MNQNSENYFVDMKELLSINHIEKEMKKASYLFQDGDEADGIYYIRSGKVSIGKVTPDGREITFRICGAGDFIGEMMPFCKSAKYRVTAKVLEDGVYAKIDKEDLEVKLTLSPNLSIEFMKWMGVNHQKTQTKFRDLILHGKKGALYSTLIRMTNSYGKKVKGGILIDIVLTNQELANFCGMTREVVNRMLSELKRDQRISMEHGKIIVHDLQFLRNEIHCENCPIEFCNID